jgi:hypothetical protein
MKKYSGFFLAGLFVLILSGCGTVSPASSVSASESGASQTTSAVQTSEKQISSDSSTVSAASASSSPLLSRKVYIVGDSTLCHFEDEKKYYSRIGYGDELSQFFSADLTFVNLALSGRSSLSYKSETQYETVFSSIQKDDFLVIGFGHNDEKKEDATRYSSPTGDFTVEGSFQYNLFNYYVKPALEKGAKPILCTPICRYSTSGTYSGSVAHVTDNGDYPAAVRSLAAAKAIPLVDLTKDTASFLGSLTTEEAKQYFSWYTSSTIDGTHTNIWGASYNAYFFAQDIKATASEIKDYLVSPINAPAKSILAVNPTYVAPTFTGDIAKSALWTTTDPWWGTAFGSGLGAEPTASNTGENGKATSNYLGSITENTPASSYTITAGWPEPIGEGTAATYGIKGGKIASTSDGFVMVFTPHDLSKNLTFSASATIDAINPTSNQCAFGLQIRSDVYMDAKASSFVTDYVTAGVVYGSSAAAAPFGRIQGSLVKGETVTPETGKAISLSIVKSATTEDGVASYDCKFGSNEKVFAETDLNNSSRTGKCYLCLFCSRSVKVTFSSVSVTDN